MTQKINGSKITKGITGAGSGQNQVIVMQKNGVIRVKPLGRTKKRVRKV